MKAEDLRIGNWVLLDTNKVLPAWHQVQAEDIFNIANGKVESLNITVDPIPLTPKILEKCEFESESQSEFSKKFTHINSAIGYDWHSENGWAARYYGHYIKCEYIHQLQNLFYSICGEELKINL